MELIYFEPRVLPGLFLGNGRATEGSQEEVEQTLSGGDGIHDFAGADRMRFLVDESSQPVTRGLQPLKEERVDGCVTGRELCRMNVTALEESIQ